MYLKIIKLRTKKVKFNEYPYDENKLKILKENLIDELKKINNDPISIDESGLYLVTNNNYG
jgi:hypothetical protein